MLEGLCVAEGYVKKNSIEILDLNDNSLDIFNFTGKPHNFSWDFQHTPN